MASILLSAAGGAVGASIPFVGPVIGATIGRSLGATVGGFIDNAVFGTPTRQVEGTRLSDLAVQVSTYGKTIPILYGTMRIAGNIIWATSLKETVNTTTTRSGGGKGSSGGTRTTATTYSYSVSLAIALCAGEISEVVRAWADAKLLDASYGNYRIYRGTQDQLPDPLMEAIEGAGNVPAYRGLAYIVLEDFPLADFGNRIPNFSFEVKRPVRTPDYGTQTTEEMITAMTLIPGAGEFVYDTMKQTKIEGEAVGAGFAQTSFQTPINYNTHANSTDMLLSLDQLAHTCPNVEWVSVVVTWFGDDLDAGACEIKPAVEYQGTAITSPNAWSVAGYTRESARQITLIEGNPRYGGTPDDAGVLRTLAELRARGYNIMFYPMFFMDTENKPWRGRVTGSATDVANFFTKTHGYNAFITHYANLVKDKVDAFVIGSELIGLTKVSSSIGVYPAVNALVSLAATVKGIMGAPTKLTYAADWSEYHHTEGGWYNLDPLWASPHMDMIGIDAYFPLTNAPQRELGYGLAPVMQGWESGEGYDFYYTNPERTTTAPLAPAYAWKNMEWFWSNAHVNPNGVTTAWIPESKKIWFTEFGFPSVDGATNQPNVFYDPTSSESFFPRFSGGMVDMRAQRTGITATLAYFQDSPFLERMFLWTWDARPFPYFPDLRSVWADGGVWATGHWVTGKFGISGLAAIVRDICLRAGLSDAQIDVTRLNEIVEGYIISGRTSARAALEELMQAFFFDAVESENTLRFVPRGNVSVADIPTDTLLLDGKDTALHTLRLHALELPQLAEVNFIDRTRGYQISTSRATRHTTESRQKVAFNMPMVLSHAQATAMAEKHLYRAWLERTAYRFSLDAAHYALHPTDVITIEEENATHTLRLTHITQDAGRLVVEAIAEDITLYDTSRLAEETPPIPIAAPRSIPATEYVLLDIPAFPSDTPNAVTLRIAAIGLAAGWQGAALYAADLGNDYVRISDIGQSAVMGKVQTIPNAFMGGNVLDETSILDVLLLGGGELQTISEQALLNGGNACVVGDEVLQFMNASLLATGKYRLSRLLRGRLGTEHATHAHSIGERFVLLDNAIADTTMSPASLGLSRNYKAVSIGTTLGSAATTSFTFTGQCLKPYAPVHLSAEGTLGSDVTVTWVRRDRLYGAWRDGVDVGMAEAQECYEIEIVIDGDVVRTERVTFPNFTYTLAMQTLDGASTATSIIARIMQLSSIVGRGHAATYAIL